ncbi:mitochondrial ribosomal protein MRP51 [Hypoxylon trugodes]|uniref:mitochondrial ribosomal protein MRP51 n=1 Tax=Hypoxylon trugodes TaxID=326681 RepID=UPI00219A5327|nr:mitochondrial ribosomal protein MRP51 [Hypoxylon trugodes]KAI1386292.1 mitochondrial ribosomal protein MRP51 [Hypoxylon trugodes]
MAGRSVSPGAALLRSSRMFSIPAPIPVPPGDHAAATRFYSPTATIAYPTHLTVTTTSSSRVNGDWGFKRPFPAKTTTKTTYPLIRVRQVDSAEHVTDFQSASDHAITLRKYQEMHLPISLPSGNSRDSFSQSTTPKSVFEEAGDVTALNEEQKIELANKRWKFSGPWLAGMTDGDFNRYLEKTARGKRSEFRAFLRKTLAAEITASQAQKAIEAGENEEPSKVTASDITDTQFTDYLRELRDDRMALYNLVSRFLDLAPIDLGIEYNYISRLTPGKERVLERGSPYGANGPPITHPSAGISYLRTRNFQENHPIYGPQQYHAPVKGRVVKPSGGGNFWPSIGVAGFIASTPSGDSVFNAKAQRLQGKFKKTLHQIDLANSGGSKIYVDPYAATVDSYGRVCINIGEANPVAEVIQKELGGEATVLEDELRAMEVPEVPRNTNTPRSFSSRPGHRVSGSASSYGLGIGRHAHARRTREH